MPNETLISEIENMLAEIVRLGGENERSQIVPNLTVQNASPGITGFVIVSDDRDGNNILAKTVPGVIYANNDLVNVMFLRGGEAIAFQQGSQSANAGIWEIVPSTSTDIYYDRGDVGIGKSVAPDAALEILHASQAQLRLTHTEDIDFVDFQIDTNADLTISPSGTGQIILQPTTDSVDFFQVLDADGGIPVLNVDSTNERVGIGTASPVVSTHIVSADTATLEVESTGGTGNANVIITRDATIDFASLVFQTENTVDWQFQVRADVDDARALVWRNGSNQNKMALLQTGELGVGTTNPQAELHVSGAGAIDLEVESTSSNANLIITRDTTSDFASFIFRTDNTQDWQFQVRADIDDARALVWRNGSNQNKVFFFQTGEFGVGIQPEGILHSYDSISGFLIWEYDGLDGTVRTIVPNGSGDCLYRLHAAYVLRDSAAAVASGTTDVSNSASVNLTVGGNTVRLRVNADGSIDTSRTAGTDTIKVAYTLRWL